MELSTAMVDAARGVQAIRNRVNRVRPFVEAHPEVFGVLDADTVDEWLAWTANIIVTRAYGPRRKDDHAALVPFSDLLNHEEGNSALVHKEDAEAVRRFVAVHGSVSTEGVDPKLIPRIAHYGQFAQLAVAAGQPVRAAYGRLLGNAHLLTHYGFVQRGGLGDQVSIVHYLTPGDGAIYLTKRRALESHGIKFGSDGGCRHSVHAQQPLTEVLRGPMTFARVMVLTADEMSEQVLQAALLGPVSFAVEARAMKMLSKAANTYAESLRSAIQQRLDELFERFPGEATSTEMDSVVVLDGHIRALKLLCAAVRLYWQWWLQLDSEAVGDGAVHVLGETVVPAMRVDPAPTAARTNSTGPVRVYEAFMEAYKATLLEQLQGVVDKEAALRG